MSEDITYCARMACTNILCLRHRFNIKTPKDMKTARVFRDCPHFMGKTIFPGKKEVYACDPGKHKECPKTNCFIVVPEDIRHRCWMTTKKEYAYKDSKEEN